MIRVPIGRRPEPAPLASLSAVLDGEPAMTQLRRYAPTALDGLELAYLEAQRYLLPQDRELCQLRIREGTEAAARLISAEDGAAAGAQLTRRNIEAHAHLRRHGTRRLMRKYSAGMYWGIIGSILVLPVIGVAALTVLRLFATITGNKDQVAQAILPLSHTLVCVGGGAVGATLSVLMRIRNNLHRLDYHASGTRAAVLRIVLGWFFAVALLALIKGGIVTLLREPDTGANPTIAELTTAWFFWAAIGLLAGFNERWARDLVTREPADSTPGTPPAAGSGAGKDHDSPLEPSIRRAEADRKPVKSNSRPPSGPPA